MMHSDEKFKKGQIVTDGSELLIVEQTPTLTDNSYVVSSFENVEDLVDGSGGFSNEHVATGTRSAGAAVGTMHRDR
jgi:hypothetical protein